MDCQARDAAFHDALQGLRNGDFSRLAPLFSGARPAQIIQWQEEGRFRNEPEAVAEALTCACFLGETEVAEYLLRRGEDHPSALRQPAATAEFVRPRLNTTS